MTGFWPANNYRRTMPNGDAVPNTSRQNKQSPARSQIPAESGSPVRNNRNLFSAAVLQPRCSSSDSLHRQTVTANYDQRFKVLACRSHVRLRVQQFVVQGAQSIGEHARAADDRHEVRVAGPARHNMDVQVIGNTRARALAKIQPDVESLRLYRGAQKRLRMDDQVP